MCFFREVLTMC